MSKKYDIDVEFLKYVKSIISESKAFQREVDLFLINRLINILSNCDQEATCQRQIEQQLFDDLDDVSFYRHYYPYVRHFRSKGDNPNEPYTPKYTSLILSDEDTVSMVCDFHREMGYDEDDIKDLVDDADGHLKFIRATSNIEGETTFINTTGEFFCLSPNYPDFTKATILTHETVHIFDWYFNPDFIKAYLLKEFNALFREMVACDYYAKKLGLQDDNYKRRYAMHSIIKRCADDVFYRTQILHLFARDHTTGSMGRIYNIFGVDYLKYLTQESLAEDYIYQIAYLIAIELYTLFQNDREKALWIANKLVTCGNNSNVLSILDKNGIVLNEHSLDYENELVLRLGIKKTS